MRARVGLLLAWLCLGVGWVSHGQALDRLAQQQRFGSLCWELPHLLCESGSQRAVAEREGELVTLWSRLHPGETSAGLARIRQQGDRLQQQVAAGQVRSANALLHETVLPAVRELTESLPNFAGQRSGLQTRERWLALASLGLGLLSALVVLRAPLQAAPSADSPVSEPLFNQPLLRAMNSLLIVISPDGWIQAVNEATCQALGYRDEELVGMSYQEVYCERPDPLTMASRRDLEGVYRTRSGAFLPVVMACSVVKQEGRIQALITLAQDVSEQQRVAADLESSESRLRSLLGRYVGAQEEERRAVARDVHDGLLQYIVAAQLQLQALERDLGEGSAPPLERARAHLQSAVDEGRRLIQNLRPAALAELGLAETLHRMLEEAGAESGWQVRWQENLSGVTLNPALETTLYRLVQEALSNSRKHAQAQWVSLQLMRRDDTIDLEYHDSGQGFEPHSRGGGMGLESMRERAELLGGWLQISSQPGAGTTIRAGFPFSPPVPVEPL